MVVSDTALDDHKTNDHNSLHASTSKKGLLDDGNPKGGFQLLSLPNRVNFLRINSSGALDSPSAQFRRIADERDEISRSVPSSTSSVLRERINGVLSKKIDWASLRKLSNEWIRKPYNMVLLLWVIAVAISGAILFLVMTGMLNAALPKKSERDTWFEVNNQIINALFALMCLYQHPKRFHHLVLLCRWKPKDILELRKTYCKNGTYKPHEWTHMMVVVSLLHLNCLAQYSLCGLNFGYKRSERPAIGVGVCLTVSIAAAATAGLYCILSPLGRDYESQSDEESQGRTLTQPGATSLEKRLSFAPRNEGRIMENSPVWNGGLFDFWDDITLAYLSLFCSFCVLGWNMERLGFGNMYVHIATFVLFCTAPFWIFNLAAVNINNETVREALGVTGIVLCWFGLLYGGFWRIQMRKRFNLPENKVCFGKPDVTDFGQWLLCCWCSLAQEVRTADLYDIVEHKFYLKKMCENDNGQSVLSPLPRENGAAQFRASSSSPIWNGPNPSKVNTEASPSTSRVSGDRFDPDRYFPRVEEGLEGVDDSLEPPIPPVIHR